MSLTSHLKGANMIACKVVAVQSVRRKNMIYTSRYANPELKTGNYTPVRISLGAPRWKIGYTIAGAIKELMPSGLRHIENLEEFCQSYYERLDSVGVNKIREQIQQYESFGKPVVLLCFEDIRKGGENWCHRTAFAKWWQARTGESIPELKDDSTVKIEGDIPKMPEVSSIDSLEEKSSDELTVLVVYSTWEDTGGDMYYIVDSVTGKCDRISDEKARELISSGKAKLKVDYDSVPKISFILAENSVKQVFRNRKGKESEITFELARKLLIDGKATIQDIELER